jgi:hypothetical protein
MNKYRRPLIAIAAIMAVSTLMSACIVVPARGYRYKYRYYGEVTPPVAPAVAPTAQA